ncbi:hypothetical protein MSAN_01896800 [Mycena sanguinolenta]|uniref:Uncharacterized protein n=1 Tax=Mycena sanguinolenta TaxID=230812 RepID=A0A8H6XPQ7_9AGAR|nr:hypothetical protein MSAN_01896800 [Mycena sanguinolenta]
MGRRPSRRGRSRPKYHASSYVSTRRHMSDRTWRGIPRAGLEIGLVYPVFSWKRTFFSKFRWRGGADAASAITKQQHTSPILYTMRPLPPLQPETEIAVQQSSAHAAAWAAEAEEERISTREARMNQILQDWVDCGFDWFSPEYVVEEVTAEHDRRMAFQTFLHYGRLRLAKIMRAHIRRYKHLRYLHELVHPPFQCELPEVLEDWEDVGVLVGVLRRVHEMVHPPFSHPHFREDPALLCWRLGIDISRGRGWGGGGWGSGGWGSDGWETGENLTQADYEISPIFPIKPLPQL